MKSTIGLIVLAVIAIFIGSSAFFVVPEGKQAIVLQFGKPVGEPRKDAGLYFKIPMIQDVRMFEKRLLKWDGKRNEIPTSDKKYLWVDTTARWRITDPLLFLRTVATEASAQSRLDDIIDSVVRDLVSKNLLVELVRSKDWQAGRVIKEMDSGAVDLREQDKASAFYQKVKFGRRQITLMMLAEARKLTPGFGIELVDIQIKRVNYVERVRRQVYERMISERRRIASQYRSEGEGQKQRILGEMQKKLAAIRSEAYKKAQLIRGKADATATEVYGKAFNQDAGFYAAFKTLETYRGLPLGKLELIMSTDGEYFKYLKKHTPQGLGK